MIDAAVPDDVVVYAIRLATRAELSEPFQSLLDQRVTRLIYVGQAEKQTLLKPLLGNELRPSARQREHASRLVA